MGFVAKPDIFRHVTVLYYIMSC